MAEGSGWLGIGVAKPQYRDEFNELANQFQTLWHQHPELSITLLRCERLKADDVDPCKPATWPGKVRIQWGKSDPLAAKLDAIQEKRSEHAPPTAQLKALVDRGVELLLDAKIPELADKRLQQYGPFESELWIHAVLLFHPRLLIHPTSFGRPKRIHPVSRDLIESRYPLPRVAKYCEEFARACAEFTTTAQPDSIRKAVADSDQIVANAARRIADTSKRASDSIRRAIAESVQNVQPLIDKEYAKWNERLAEMGMPPVSRDEDIGERMLLLAEIAGISANEVRDMTWAELERKVEARFWQMKMQSKANSPPRSSSNAASDSWTLMYKAEIRDLLKISPTELRNRIAEREIPVHPDDLLPEHRRKKQIRVDGKWVSDLRGQTKNTP